MFTLSTGARLCPSSVSDVYNYNRHISYEKSDMLANHAATCLLFWKSLEVWIWCINRCLVLAPNSILEDISRISSNIQLLQKIDKYEMILNLKTVEWFWKKCLTASARQLKGTPQSWRDDFERHTQHHYNPCHGATSHLFQPGSLLWCRFNTPRTIRCSWVVRIFPKWPLLSETKHFFPTHMCTSIDALHLENPSILSVLLIFHISQTWESHYPSQTEGLWNLAYRCRRGWHWQFWTPKQNQTS